MEVLQVSLSEPLPGSDPGSPGLLDGTYAPINPVPDSPHLTKYMQLDGTYWLYRAEDPAGSNTYRWVFSCDDDSICSTMTTEGADSQPYEARQVSDNNCFQTADVEFGQQARAVPRSRRDDVEIAPRSRRRPRRA